MCVDTSEDRHSKRGDRRRTPPEGDYEKTFLPPSMPSLLLFPGTKPYTAHVEFPLVRW